MIVLSGMASFLTLLDGWFYAVSLEQSFGAFMKILMKKTFWLQ